MNKKFTVLMPDEPFRTTVSKNKKVNCTYTGPRYLLVSIDSLTKEVDHISKQSDSKEDIDIESFNEENHIYVIIDAEMHPFEAAYISQAYVNENVPLFEEKVTDSFSWKYQYQENTGIFSDIFYGKLKYNIDNQKFVQPNFMQHPMSKETYFESINVSIQHVETALIENSYPREQEEKIKQFHSELKTLLNLYKKIDHWKIPFPETPSLAPNTVDSN